MSQKLYWISPEGDFKSVSNHRWYAFQVTGVYRGDPDDDKVYNEMFKRKWIRGVLEGRVLYLNNSLSSYINSLSELNPDQETSIRNFLELNRCWAENSKRDRIDNVNENMNPSQTNADLKNKLGNLFNYMSKRLSIKNTPKLSLKNDVKNSKKPFGLTGFYNKQDQSIVLYITDRHPTDILRSFAHELTHHWQNEHGELEGKEIQSHYTQNDPHMRKKEMEAYLLGNILFRDFQDEQRYGRPEKQPFLMSINENIFVSNPTKLKDIIRQMIRMLVANQIITTQERNLTSGKMDPNDFIEDFSNKISSELTRQINRINDRGNWESQGQMVQ